MLNITNYSHKSWVEKYDESTQIKIEDLPIHYSWKKIVLSEPNKELYKKVEKYLKHCIEYTNRTIKIYPYPDLLFETFNMVPLTRLRVVILGQDPYHQNVLDNDKIVPQAMGLSFSVPVGVKIPPSLKNIYENLLKYGNICTMPKHGNLTSWAYQGCLLLNTSLTVQHGIANSHAKYWTSITDNIIKSISDNCNSIVFLLWGKPAISKDVLIDSSKHKIIRSSHPSPLSVNDKCGTYNSFSTVDHFGETNKYLIEHGKQSIVWQL